MQTIYFPQGGFDEAVSVVNHTAEPDSLWDKDTSSEYGDMDWLAKGEYLYATVEEKLQMNICHAAYVAYRLGDKNNELESPYFAMGRVAHYTTGYREQILEEVQNLLQFCYEVEGIFVPSPAAMANIVFTYARKHKLNPIGARWAFKLILVLQGIKLPWPEKTAK